MRTGIFWDVVFLTIPSLILCAILMRFTLTVINLKKQHGDWTTKFYWQYPAFAFVPYVIAFTLFFLAIVDTGPSLAVFVVEMSATTLIVLSILALALPATSIVLLDIFFEAFETDRALIVWVSTFIGLLAFILLTSGYFAVDEFQSLGNGVPDSNFRILTRLIALSTGIGLIVMAYNYHERNKRKEGAPVEERPGQ